MDYKEHESTSWPTLHQKVRLREKPWLTDEERERLRRTGRTVYGEYPYVKTDGEKEWESARAERG